jgi:dihydrofolate reductase
MAGKVHVFVASSLDGFMAGPDHDLSWLPPPDPTGADNGFGAFMEGIGVLLMGRTTFDVVDGFEGPWFYGDTPVLVASHRSLLTTRPTVRHVEGDIFALLAHARAVAGAKDVYIDGGSLIRQALDAGLVDSLTVTVIPAILGKGLPLFAGAERRQRLQLVESKTLSEGMVQLVYIPAPSA